MIVYQNHLIGIERSINGSLFLQQAISLIETIFMSKDEVTMIHDLDGNGTQASADVVNEV